MKYYIFLIITTSLLIISLIINTISYKTDKAISILNIIISIVVFFLSFIVPEKYDYEKENPNALVKGKNISGTVYSDNEENTPGLGWIL
jgi:hypothetical protein